MHHSIIIAVCLPCCGQLDYCTLFFLPRRQTVRQPCLHHVTAAPPTSVGLGRLSWGMCARRDSAPFPKCSLRGHHVFLPSHGSRPCVATGARRARDQGSGLLPAARSQAPWPQPQLRRARGIIAHEPRRFGGAICSAALKEQQQLIHPRNCMCFEDKAHSSFISVSLYLRIRTNPWTQGV